MSFDDLIGLLVFLLFVGVPLFNRIRRGRNRTPQARRTRPQAPTSAPGETQPATVELDPDDPIARRLEEARRRVEAARGGQTPTQSTTPAAPPTGGAPQTPPPRSVAPAGPSAVPPAPSPAPFLPPPVVAAPPPPLPSFTRAAAPTSEPLKVERRKRRPRPYAIDRAPRSMHPDDLMSLEADDIVRGILWHQILSEPVALKGRGRGRKPSPPPSR